MSTAAALFTDAQQKLYRWLFGQPTRSFHLSELRRLSGLGSASLQRELNRLVEAGVVHSEYVGNQRHFQANAAAPIYVELVALVQKTVGIAEPLKTILERFRDEITCAFVYGSIAKETEVAGSDIDLLIVSDVLGHIDLAKALVEAEQKTGRPVHVTIYSSAELEQKKSDENAFVTRVLAQPKIWLIGDEHQLGA